MKQYLAILLSLLPILSAPEQATAQVKSASELGVVCRAGIAALMGHDIKIVRLDKVDGEIAHVSYSRPSDQKTWKNRCRIEGSTLIWGTIDAFGPGTGFGPWRNRPEDEKVTFKLDRGSVTVVQAFGRGENVTTTFATK